MEQAIDDFHGEYYWLDNMWLGQIKWSDKLTFNAVEQGFVYFKTLDPIVRQEILLTDDPYEVKSIGRNMAMRPDWDDVKFGIMYELVRRKFLQDQALQVKLVHTGGALLLEGNTWDDNIWGDCTCPNCRDIPGQNWLGKILMSLRAQFQDE